MYIEPGDCKTNIMTYMFPLKTLISPCINPVRCSLNSFGVIEPCFIRTAKTLIRLGLSRMTSLVGRQPSKHVKADQYRPTSGMSFKWRFAGVPIVARGCMPVENVLFYHALDRLCRLPSLLWERFR